MEPPPPLPLSPLSPLSSAVVDSPPPELLPLSDVELLLHPDRATVAVIARAIAKANGFLIKPLLSLYLRDLRHIKTSVYEW